MKRNEILKKLREAGFVLVEGKRHTHVLDAKGYRISVVGRHAEIREDIVRSIERQTGVALR